MNDGTVRALGLCRASATVVDEKGRLGAVGLRRRRARVNNPRTRSAPVAG
jgi:hypothetical protein